MCALEIDDRIRLLLHADTVLDEKRYKLLAVHECDGHGIRPSCLGHRAGREVAGGDDQTLFMRAQAATHLLDDGGLDPIG